MDLSLVPLNEMLDEVRRRFDTVVFLGRRDIDGDNDEIIHSFKDKIGCLGLMRIADQKLKEGYADCKLR